MRRLVSHLHHKTRHAIGVARSYHKTDVLLLLAGFGMFLVGLFGLWIINLNIPDLSSFTERRVSQSTKIYDRTGTILLFNVHSSKQRTTVPFDSISRNIKNASIAIEDAEFYQHFGIKPLSILRAIIVDVLTLSFDQGGSTITQQVVKNSLLTQDKTISRKIKEWVLAIKLERHATKDQILEVYLNENPYGGSIYGVEEASESFFGKPSSDLTITEAAYIAALPQAPTYYSPYGNHRDKLEDRKNLVLAKMLENKFITEDEYSKAINETVTFLPQSTNSLKAPHFVFYVLDYLEKKYGKEALDDGGLKVITTLDYALQQKGEQITKTYALSNKEKYNAENAALVAIDPKTGQILTMVGSRDYFDADIDGNFNIALAKRQPGSSFKPFVYATAFAKGYQPETTVFDVPTEFSSTCTPEGEPLNPQAALQGECYHPVNYDGKYRGPISLRDAIAQSLNVPSVQVLYLAGIADSIQTARTMGITTLSDNGQYGLTLVLGGGEVTLLDMTSAYGVFADDGVRNPYTGILKVEDQGGATLEEFSPRPTNAISSDVARTISDVLSDNVARAPAFGDASYLYFPGRDVADKTGTTNDYRDAWVLGYTPSLVVGAWAGNNDNSPMEKKVAGFIIAPLWNAFMQEALKNFPNEPLPKPEPKDPSTIKPILRGVWQGGKTYIVDKFTGKLATEFTPPEAQEERVVKNIHSILYWVNKDDPLGPPPTHPENDPQFRLWEAAAQKWAQEQHITNDTDAVIPTGFDNIHTGASQPKITINGIQNTSYSAQARITVSATGTGLYPMSRFDFYVNDVYVGSVKQAPFQFSFTPADIDGIKNQNTLKVVGYDSVLNKGQASISFQTH